MTGSKSDDPASVRSAHEPLKAVETSMARSACNLANEVAQSRLSKAEMAQALAFSIRLAG